MKIYTAPMAGITDYSFRKILKKFEPDFMFTEMVNANLLNREDGTTVNELLKCDEKEKTGTQIFGGDRNELVSGIFKLKDFGFRKININMGCPQPKITKNGAGSALLENFELVEEVLLETKDIWQINIILILSVFMGGLKNRCILELQIGKLLKD